MAGGRGGLFLVPGFARTAIEGFAYDDYRFGLLAHHLGLPKAECALGLISRVWSWQTENYQPDRPTYIVDPITIDVLMGMHGASEALVKAHLAEHHPDGLRIRGAVGRIEWLWKNRHNAPSGGRARHCNPDDNDHPPGMPPGNPGGNPPGSDCRSSGSKILVPDLDLSPSGDLPLSADLPPPEDPNYVGTSGALDSEQLRAYKAVAEPKVAAARAAKAARVHERAWKAADYFRDLVLEEYPQAAIGRRKWEGTTGIRLEWAYLIHLLVSQDKRTFEQIADVLDWLFHKQPAGRHRFVVQSPDALRSKWDRIEANRRIQSSPERQEEIRNIETL